MISLIRQCADGFVNSILSDFALLRMRISSRQIHINEPVTNTKSGCEECNLTDQRRDAGLDGNTQATTKYSANASGNIQIQIHKYNHANTNTDTNTNTQ